MPGLLGTGLFGSGLLSSGLLGGGDGGADAPAGYVGTIFTPGSAGNPPASKLSYAGFSLLLPDREGKLAGFLDRNLPLMDMRLFCEPIAKVSCRTQARGDHPNFRRCLPVPNYPDPPPMRINTLYWPTGAARWSCGLFLATTSIKDKILNVTGTTNEQAPLVMVDKDRFGLQAQMHLLAPRPLSAVVAGGSGEELWILPLVDERYYWQMMDANDLEVTNETTWNDLLEDLVLRIGRTSLVGPASATPTAFGRDTILSGYLRPDRVEFNRPYENVALLLDAIAHSVGQRVVRAVDGSAAMVNTTRSQSIIVNNLSSYGVPFQALAGGEFDNLSSALPEKVRVIFPVYLGVRPLCCKPPRIKEVTAADVGISDYTRNTMVTVFSSAGAEFEDGDDFATDDPQNDTELENLALLIATSVYNWRIAKYDYSFASIKPWAPCGYDDYVMYSFGAQLADGSYDAKTRVQTLPVNFGVEEVLQQGLDTKDASLQLKGKLDENLLSGESALMNVWELSDDPSPVEEETGEQITVYDWDFINDGEMLAAGVSVYVTFLCPRWYVSQASECGVPEE